MTEDLKVKVRVYNGGNLSVWKKMVLLAVGEEKCLAALSIDPNAQGKTKPSTEVQDNSAQNILLNSLHEDVSGKVVASDTASAMWDRRLSIYEDKDAVNVNQLLEVYNSYQMDTNNDMSTHNSKVESLAVKLKQVGQPQSNESVMAELLHNLPDNYSSLREARDCVHTELMTLENPTKRLLNQASTRESFQASCQDMAPVATNNTGSKQSKASKKKRVESYRCGKLSHYKRGCRSLKDESSQTSPGDIARVLNRDGQGDQWVVDSGYSMHTCCQRNWFNTFTSSSEKHQIGNQDWAHEQGRGTVELACIVGSSITEVTLEDVVYIPEMSFNVFSTGRAAERGAITVLSRDKCTITVNCKIVAEGVRDEATGLFMLQANSRRSLALLISNLRTMNEWHKALGDLDQQIVESTQTDRPCADHATDQPGTGANHHDIAQEGVALLNCVDSGVGSEPTTYQQAIEGPDKQRWLEAIAEELSAHLKDKTWSIIKRPVGAKLITAEWVFEYKRDHTGDIEQFKAYLVSRGFLQASYGETFAPVAKVESMRVLLALAAAKRLTFERFGVSPAFLNGTVNEDVYMQAPEGVQVSEGQCLKLNKALYELKQAPRIWNRCFDKAIKSLGFEPTKCDSCVYASKDKLMYLAAYVDDGIIVGPSNAKCLAIIKNLNKCFKTSRVNGSVFLGIKIKCGSKFTRLSRGRYIDDMLKTFHMDNCSPVSSPMLELKSLYELELEAELKRPYRAAVERLLDLALSTRPDILFPTIMPSRSNEKPEQVHWNPIKQVMRYLKGTRKVGLL